jgi:hypothetical protein
MMLIKNIYESYMNKKDAINVVLFLILSLPIEIFGSLKLDILSIGKDLMI